MAETQRRDGLPPLEYSDCFLDSPSFRDLIDLYDKELEANGADVKALIKGCQSMIDATQEFSKVQQAFAHQLAGFKFQTIGHEKTEDEQLIMNSFQTFAKLLFAIEDYRQNMICIISVRLLKTLDNFRKEQVHKARDEKKKFEKCAEKYYTTLDNYLRMSVKKKEPNVLDNNSQLERDAAGFKQAAFDYACKLQDVHAIKQYELVEPIIGYIGDLTTFLHQAYEEATSHRSELLQVQFKVQILRETHESEQEEAYQLKARVIEEGEAGIMQHAEFIRQGQLMVQDKKGAVGPAWHRYFCQFKKKDNGPGKPKAKLLRLTPTGRHGGGIPSMEFLEVLECVRCKADDIDRRFCFEVEVLTSKDQRRYVMQAFSEEGRKQWLETMEGKEPTYVTMKKEDNANNKLSPEGLEFVKKCLELIEKRGGMEEEGIYRKPGIIAKCSKLVKDFADRKLKISEMDQLDEYEWDNKTISSAVRAYLGKQLCEPLMTFVLHEQFIAAAKVNDHEKRVECIKTLVDQLPSANRQVLAVVVAHLHKIQALSEKNFMKASNLGVVFGPTLMRPERESVATIVDIKYQNIVVEVMIDEIFKIFPELQDGSPPTPKPSKLAEVSKVVMPPPTMVMAPPTMVMAPPTMAMAPPTMVMAPPTMVMAPPTTVTAPPITEQRPSVSSDMRPSENAVLEAPIPIRPPREKERDRERPTVPPRLTTKLSQKDLTQAQETPAQSTDVRRRVPPPVPKYKPAINASEIVARRSQLITTAPDFAKLPTPKFDSTPLEADVHERQGSSPEPVRDKEGSSSPPPRAKQSRTARAKFDCDAGDTTELSFKKDEVLLNVVRSEEPGWWQATTVDGRIGLVPENYMIFD